jgi:hypothetical protein
MLGRKGEWPRAQSYCQSLTRKRKKNRSDPVQTLFLHGWQSTPGGLKPNDLKSHGHEVLNPVLPDDDFDAAVRIAEAEYDHHRPDVVVGSRRGVGNPLA